MKPQLKSAVKRKIGKEEELINLIRKYELVRKVRNEIVGKCKFNTFPSENDDKINLKLKTIKDLIFKLTLEL